MWFRFQKEKSLTTHVKIASIRINFRRKCLCDGDQRLCFLFQLLIHLHNSLGSQLQIRFQIMLSNTFFIWGQPPRCFRGYTMKLCPNLLNLRIWNLIYVHCVKEAKNTITCRKWWLKMLHFACSFTLGSFMCFIVSASYL